MCMLICLVVSRVCTSDTCWSQKKNLGSKNGLQKEGKVARVHTTTVEFDDRVSFKKCVKSFSFHTTQEEFKNITITEHLIHSLDLYLRKTGSGEITWLSFSKSFVFDKFSVRFRARGISVDGGPNRCFKFNRRIVYRALLHSSGSHGQFRAPFFGLKTAKTYRLNESQASMS